MSEKYNIKNDSITERARAPPEILYHGTNEDYLRLCLKKDQPHLSEIELTDQFINAMSFAAKRGKQYSSIPVVLIVDTNRVDSLNYFHPYWKGTLPLNSFRTSSAPTNYRPIGNNWIQEILSASKTIQSIAPDELFKENIDKFTLYKRIPHRLCCSRKV